MASNRKPAKTLRSHNVLVIIKLVMYTSCSISRANFECYILNIIVVNCCIVMCGITVYNTIFFLSLYQPLSLEEMIARREAEKKAQEKVQEQHMDHTANCLGFLWTHTARLFCQSSFFSFMCFFINFFEAYNLLVLFYHSQHF